MLIRARGARPIAASQNFRNLQTEVALCDGLPTCCGTVVKAPATDAENPCVTEIIQGVPAMDDAEEIFVFSIDAIEVSEEYVTEELELLGDDDLYLLGALDNELNDEIE